MNSYTYTNGILHRGRMPVSYYSFPQEVINLYGTAIMNIAMMSYEDGLHNGFNAAWDAWYFASEGSPNYMYGEEIAYEMGRD